MSEFLVLRLDAPMMSFGGEAIDAHRVTAEFPGRSLVCGLIANALGHDHSEFERTARLQERIVMGSRRDRAGRRISDFQTVSLGQAHLAIPGWTTTGRTSEREGGSASTGTHIRHRHFVADAVFTVVVRLESADEAPTLDDVEAALRSPARTLFIGRKAALPSTSIFAGRVTAPDVRSALAAIPRLAGRTDAGPLSAWWPADDLRDEPSSRVVPVFDDRDWANQIHTGRRFVRHGIIDVPEVIHAG